MFNDVQFSAFWKKIETTKGVDVLGMPLVLTRSGQETMSEFSREFAYKDAQGKAATKKLGIKLTLLPKVTRENRIDLDLSPEIVDFEGFLKHANGLEQAIFSERKVTAKVSMTSGETVLLRFPATSTEQTAVNRLPGDGSTKTKNVPKQMLVFVTARLVNPATGKPVDSNPATNPRK